MERNSLTEESKPWLEPFVKPEVQESQEKQYELGSSRLQTVNKSTTKEKKTQKILPQVLASVFVASFHIVVGISMAYSAILVPQLETDELSIDKSASAWLASAMVLMVPVGAISAGVIMETYGRLNAIRLGAIPAIIGWIMIASGRNFTVLLIGRMFTGVSSGMVTSPAVVYITEVGAPNLRGSLISSCPTLASLGMVIAYAEGMYLSWRTVAWLSLVYIAMSLVLVTAWIPESPVWLVARGRVDEADHSLKWFNGKNTQLHKDKLASMVKSQDMKALVSSGFFQRMKGFLKPTGYKPMLVLSGLFFFQQFSGIYSTLFYAVTFFQDVGSGIDPTLATVLMGSVRCLMSGCNTGLMKRFGRRPLCMLSGCGMTICLSVSGYFTWKILKEGNKELNWVPVMCIMLYVVTSMLGLLSIPWTMTAELFPTEIRGLAHSIAISVANLLMFVSIQTYLTTVDALGGPAQMQWFYAAMALLGALFVYIFLPETHNKELAEIESYFRTNSIYIGSKKRMKVDNRAI